MRRVLKFILLVVFLTAVRYVVGGPLEKLLIADRLTATMEREYGFFNWQPSSIVWATSYFYSFMIWFLVSLVYVKIYPMVHGHPIWKSLKVYGVMFLYFATVSAMYMNQYSHSSDFYLYNILDRMIIFPLVAVANGLLHPRLFRDAAAAQKHARLHAPNHSPLAGTVPATPHGSPAHGVGLHRP